MRVSVNKGSRQRVWAQRFVSMAWLLALLWLHGPLLYAQQTPYELGNGNQSTTYADCIRWYQQLAAQSDLVQITEAGGTDIGQPLHSVVISAHGFNPVALRAADRAVVFINNGIHAGEPEGIDASMALARWLSTSPEGQALLADVVVVIVPIYNVGGSLNRNSFTRANQNGPEEYGFRGNARNLDLNRDFIKLDSENARSLVRLTRLWDPDLYFETHTTNGADYQHIMTLIETQRDKLRPEVSRLMQDKITPFLYEGMAAFNMPMCPYVNTRASTPESGILSFLDHPRYGTGYLALFHCPGYVLETHMLKSYQERYRATFTLLQLGITIAAHKRADLLQARAAARQACATASSMALNWRNDTSRVDSFFFRGYTAIRKPSAVHGGMRLFYDRTAPWQANIPYYPHALGLDSCVKPQAYLIPQAWREVIDRLRWNGVSLFRLERDTSISVEMYRILDYKSAGKPYEGHFLHSQVSLSPELQTRQFRAGDYVVPMGYGSDRFVMEVLEPKAVDSYFNWNYFDGMLMQKEYFSGYLFEDTAAELLAADPALRERFETWRAAQAEIPNDWLQLYWVYKNAGPVEPDLLLYPVGRLMH